jgi:hypothetical protein
MRIHLAATTALLLMLTACSTPTVEVPSATVKEAPVIAVTDPPVTEPTTPPTTLPPITVEATTTVRPNVPASRAEPSNAFVPKTDDEIAIAYIVSEFQRRFVEQEVNRTYDAGSLSDILINPGYQFIETQYAVSKKKGFYSRWGTVQQSVAVSMKVASESATAVACERNDVQVWDSKLTEDKSDDSIVDGSLAVFRLTYLFAKRGEKWFISRATVESKLGICGSVF